MQLIKYFVRKPSSDDFRGTFTLNELRHEVKEGRMAKDWDAIVAKGQSYGELKRAIGWTPLFVVLGDSANPPPHNSARTPTGDSVPREEQMPIASFCCVSCGLSMRIVIQEALYRCPQCKTQYKVSRVSDSPLVYLLIPALKPTTTQTPSEANKRKPVPPEVKSALTVFGLDETSSPEQIRQAYRDAVKLYHPDKVSHLGSDLKRLAEDKTKHFNSAFKILEAFHK